MAGEDCLMVEIATAGTTIYVGTHNYTTRAADTPANTFFESRLANDLEFSRSVGCAFWNSKPRGDQSYGSIDLINTDGIYDTLVGSSLRDKAVVVKIGQTGDAYSTFTTCATLIVDRVEFPDEKFMRVYVKDLGGKLERALQTSVYPTTTLNLAMRGQPRPLTVGKCYQVPPVQPNPYGNGQYDVHDGDQWIGLDQVLENGATLAESTGYERSTVSGIYGFERLTLNIGHQVASVQGAFKIVSTELDEGFTSLAAWTETNGGVGGRDASIVSNTLSMVNTAGGADLQIQMNASITATDSDIFYYEFDCVTFTSGSCRFTISGVAAHIEKTVDAVGRYTGIMRASAAFTARIIAVNGSNCSLTLDNLKIYKVTLIEKLVDLTTYLCVTKGPLVSGDLDSTLSTEETATPYKMGFHAQSPVQIADVLDQVAVTRGGWWWMDRLGKLRMKQLLAPTGTAAFVFDQNSIGEESGMRVEFDAAPGLSNLILAKRNWDTYGEFELSTSLQYNQLSSSDKDADVTLSAGNYNYSIANVGSVRMVPLLYGERYYVEITATTVEGTGQHYLGWANSSANIASYAGADANAIAYRANGQTYTNAAGTAYGNTWTTNDKIGLCIDGRAASAGAKNRHFRFYWHKNGTYQNSSNPTTEAAFVASGIQSTGISYLMIGNNVAGTNAGSVNFGQAAFTTAPPDDYIAPAWHRTLVMADYRYKFQTATAFHASYQHAVAAEGSGVGAGIPTLLSAEADARTECDRWGTLYSVERFNYTFDALLPAGIAAYQVEPGDLIEVTYPRFGLSSKKLRVTAVRGRMLGQAVNITAWG